MAPSIKVGTTICGYSQHRLREVNAVLDRLTFDAERADELIE